jgi:hypothetical protein
MNASVTTTSLPSTQAVYYGKSKKTKIIKPKPKKAKK